MIRALIVDDERLARSDLRRLLLAHPDVDVVAEARDADEAELRLAELEVLVRRSLDVLVVVFNDSRLSLIDIKQERRRGGPAKGHGSPSGRRRGAWR